jgi:putative ABC transport system permease protein
MIRNYFLIAWRNLVKNRTFSFINIFGLTIGLACCMFIAAFVYDEMNYDTYAKNADRIYRVGLVVGTNATDNYPLVDVAVGPGMKSAFPEVEQTARLVNAGDYFVSYQDKKFKENSVVFVDGNFLDMFSLPLAEGNSKTALAEPNSAVITRELANKYFGTEPALGKFLSFGDFSPPHKITGIIEKIPANSHFHANLMLSTSELPGVKNPTWSNVGWFTYLQLAKGVDPKKLEAKFPQLVSEHVVPEVSRDMGVSIAEARKSVNSFVFYLQKLADIHLYSNTRYEMPGNGDINYVYIFGALAILIILLACVNFTNLSTANAAKRSKEIGIRKVMGSGKKQLVFQFLAESLLMTFCALLFALVIIALALPYFNTLSGKAISFDFFIQYQSLIAMFLLVMLVGTLAGVYPAFFLSSFRIIKVLKGGSISETTGRGTLRKSLVVFQFAVSTALIIATVIVYRQLNYMQDQRLGYDKEQVLTIHDTYTLKDNQSVFVQQLKQDSRVVNTTIGRHYPGNDNMNGTQVYAREGDNHEKGGEIHINIYNIDDNYLPTLGIEMAKGRNFSKDFPSDSSAVVINETAARSLGWIKSDPLGKTIIRSGQKEYRVIGVVKDFHYASLKQKIAPLMMMLGNNSGAILVKLKTNDVKSFLADTKNKWAAFNGGAPFTYTFLDDNYANLYKSEQKIAQIFTLFAVIAILIASLGLFGLVSFTTEQRTKEIGIRKVLGANTQELLLLLSKDFLYLVLIAFVITVPLTWWGMNSWLKDFAYRLNPEWWVFAFAGVLALLIAIITISFKAIKAALANPVKSLRTE